MDILFFDKVQVSNMDILFFDKLEVSNMVYIV